MVDDRERDRDRIDAIRWREHAARHHPDQPRMYRVRLFEEQWEVPRGGVYPIVLDLSHGLPLEEAEQKLNQLFRSLLRLAKVKPDKVRLHYLDLRTWDTDQSVLHWPVTWDPEL